MLAIKLQRVGKKGQPSYRLVVAEKRSKMAAPPVEDLGSYSTFTKKGNFKAERLTHWLGKGAQPTVTVHNLLVKEGILKAAKIRLVLPKKKVVEAAPEVAAPAPAAAAEEPVAETQA